MAVTDRVVEGGEIDAALDQHVAQEDRNGGIEPPDVEPAVAEQPQDIEGVVDLLLAPPSVAAVPASDLPAVEAGELRRERRLEIRVRVAADAGVPRIARE